MPWGSTHWSPMKLPALNEKHKSMSAGAQPIAFLKFQGYEQGHDHVMMRIWAGCLRKKIINHKDTTAKFSFLPSNFIVPLWKFRDFQQNCDLRSLHISPFHISCTGACLSYSMLERVLFLVLVLLFNCAIERKHVWTTHPKRCLKFRGPKQTFKPF